VLTDDHDPSLPGNAWVENDSIAYGEAVDARPERGDDPGPVGPEYSRLRHRGETSADPEIEMVQPRRPHLDEHFPRAGLGIRNLLDHEDLWSAVFVDPSGLHWGRILA
jgi:hypothetical protein